MVALSDMYEKSSASNKVHLMKQLFNFWMIQGVSMAAHINEFSIITTQLSLVEIEFNEEVWGLILLSFLLKRWNMMVMTVSNSFGSKKMVFKDFWDLILSEQIRQRKLGETSSYTLNIESRGRPNDRNSNWSRSKSRWSKFKSTKKEISTKIAVRMVTWRRIVEHQTRIMVV